MKRGPVARRDRKIKILSSNPCAPPALLCCECGIISIVDARWGQVTQVLGRARQELPYSTVPAPLHHPLVSTGFTVHHREMETGQMETILRFASVSPRKMETLLLGSWWP